VRVSEVIRETADACSLVLEMADDAGADFSYRPGQFVTLRIPGGPDGPIARSYSLASSPHTGGELKVTVKRVPGGHGSNWICDNIAAGAVLDALPPAGTFTPRSLDADLLLFAGGSGITPVISIVKSALCGGTGQLVLIYANRDEDSVIFADELRKLAAGHPGRLIVVHWLESVQALPTADALLALARPYAGYEAFVCGPDAFMAEVAQVLRELGMPRSRVHIERFLSLSGDPFEDGAGELAADGERGGTPDEPGAGGPGAGGPAAAGERQPERTGAVHVQMDGQHHEFAWPEGTKLLDLLLDNGFDAPFSCRQGQCSACACRVEEGEVRMLHNEVLEDEDLAEGYVLACQSLPLTGIVRVSYD
jgi:3-ketosteroid 9alpha-monooxygenase subunit B